MGESVTCSSAKASAERPYHASAEQHAMVRAGRLWRGRLQAGFTLIELLIVITLIIILSTMGMTQYRASVIHAREATLKEDLFRMRDAIDQYYADKGQYPSGLDALVSDGYMRKVPEDPFTKSAETWQTVPAEPDPNNPIAEPGVYDVKSGSEATALDGTKYAEW
jgi:general secretion pathway protein G